ncbi:MAG: hypothetical protein VX910_07740 [Candidatus Latescibacterota bacterium]|nr:hypothetical protein [Candidatus Latescibacterota bacterium]
MNIQPFQAQTLALAPRPVGGQLDIHSDTPAPSHNDPAKTSNRQLVAEVGSLVGILNPHEQQALATAFGQAETPVYSGRGTSIGPPLDLGSQLDFKA